MAGEVDPVGVLGDGTVYYAPIGEVVYDGDDRVRCHLCGRSMRIVGGTHLRVVHGWTLDAYREAFQLLVKAPTCSRELSERGRENAQARLGHRRFGTPPVNAVPPVYRVPRWRSLAYARPDLISELHRTRDLDRAGEAGSSPIRDAARQCRSAGLSGASLAFVGVRAPGPDQRASPDSQSWSGPEPACGELASEGVVVL